MADKLEVVIIGKDELSATLKGIQSNMEGLADIAKGALTVGLGAATAAFGAMSAAAVFLVKEAMDAQEAEAQLNAVLKSTGGIAGVTADAVQDLSRSLSLVTRYGDDAITAGQSMLLTFTGIGKDIFPEATKAMLDMSTAMGQDLKSTAIQLGKALNSPAEGLSALTRVGVRFTAEQEQMVKSLVAQGKTVEAQKIILQELQTEFGGSAEAAGKTFAGQLDILRNKLLALAGDVGAKFLPQLEAFVTIVGPKIEAFAQNLAALLSDPAITQGISLLAAELNKLMNGNFGTLTDLIPPSVLDGFKNLAAAIQEKMPVIQGAMQFFVNWLQEAWARVGPTLIANISTALNTLAELWRKHGDTIIAALTIAFQIIGATVGGALVLLSGIITSFLQLLNGDWESAGQTLTATTDSFMNMVLSIIGTNLEEVRATWQANTEMAILIVRTFFANLVATWQANWDMVVLIIKTIWDNIQKAIAAKIIEIILNIKKFIADVLATIEGYKQAFIDMGGNMMNWMTQGIRAAAEGLMNAIRDASGRAINSVRELLPMGTTTQLQIENVQDAIIAPGGRIISTAPDDFLIATKTPGRLLGGAGAGGVTVNLYYAPAVSFGDRYEAEQTLVPILREALRQL
jgi:hypothetical protein